MKNDSYEMLNTEDSISKILKQPSSNNTRDFSTSLNSNLKAKFEDIIEKITNNYNNRKNILNIIFKKNSKTLVIQLNYKKHTDLNPLNYEIIFSITIDSDYPNSIPLVKTLTNFCFPGLFDCRNLIFSILNQNWVYNSKNLSTENLSVPLEEIIMKIPQFLNRLIENTNNKILVYYGDYIIDMIYDINEFLANSDLDFFKINQYYRVPRKLEKFKERYVILTDIFFLLFDPVPNSRNLGKLLFWGDIKQMKWKQISKTMVDDSVLLEWNAEDVKQIDFEIKFLNSSLKEFIEKSTSKAKRLSDTYKIYQDDIHKPTVNDKKESLTENVAGPENLEKLVALIKYKEELLTNQQSINLVKELMSLYQKVIEILSAKNDPEFIIYLKKLHAMLENKEIQEQLEKHNTISNSSSRKLFELSQSYESYDENIDE